MKQINLRYNHGTKKQREIEIDGLWIKFESIKSNRWKKCSGSSDSQWKEKRKISFLLSHADKMNTVLNWNEATIDGVFI